MFKRFNVRTLTSKSFMLGVLSIGYGVLLLSQTFPGLPGDGITSISIGLALIFGRNSLSDMLDELKSKEDNTLDMKKGRSLK